VSPPSGGRCNVPASISEDVVTRARVRMNFHPAARTENPVYSTEDDTVGIRRPGTNTRLPRRRGDVLPAGVRRGE
jgi:hypothetical protein